MAPSQLSPDLLKAVKREIWQSHSILKLGGKAIDALTDHLADHEQVLVQALRLRLEGRRLHQTGRTATAEYNNWWARQQGHDRRHDREWIESFLWLIDLETGQLYDEEGEPWQSEENDRPAVLVRFPEPAPQSQPTALPPGVVDISPVISAIPPPEAA